MESVLVASYCPEPWWPCFSKEVTQAGKVEVIVWVLRDVNSTVT